MDREDLIKKITKKKEYSQLPKKDVKLAFEKFDKDYYSDEEKIKFTRDLLMRVFSAFSSRKLLLLRDKDAEWFLERHKSTRERMPFYEELYKKLFVDFDGKIFLNIFDLGAGVNGFSYKFIEQVRKNFFYIGVEAVGQLVDLVNYHFKTRGIENCQAIHLSLFELEKLKKYVGKVKGDKIIFLFKAIDSLEMLERNYSKKLLFGIVPLVDRVVVSFATRSLVKQEKFKANRKWLVNFIRENFKCLSDFEFGSERYVVFKNK